MKPVNKGNPVSNRSKQLMEEALLRLMQTENFFDISIQEITDNAGLSRRTFYRNFEAKDDILKEIFHKVWSDYEAHIRQMEDFSLPNVAFVLFSVMLQHIEFLQLINQQHLLSLLLIEVDELLPPIFQEIKGSHLSFTAESISYALTFSTGGFIRILPRWLESNPLKTPKEMSLMVKDIIEISSYHNV